MTKSLKYELEKINSMALTKLLVHRVHQVVRINVRKQMWDHVQIQAELQIFDRIKNQIRREKGNQVLQRKNHE